jgi:hypothetical protein
MGHAIVNAPPDAQCVRDCRAQILCNETDQKNDKNIALLKDAL